MDLASAIAAHLEWKIKFRSAITKKEPVDEKIIANDHACALGKWLYAEGKNQYGMLKSYGKCMAEHTEFHREAGKVAKAIRAGKYTQAEVMLESGTPYATSSRRVAVAILALKNEARI